MGINWFTFIAQIVNFAILVWLLKRFLYGPIVRAMDKREENIHDRLEEAGRREKEAAEEADKHREAREKLERQRDETMAEAHKEAEEKKRELLHEAREEVEQRRRDWQTELERGREAFVEELRRRLAESLRETARKALADLADRELEAQTLECFERRLADLSDEDKSALKAAREESDKAARIRAAFGVDDERRERLAKAAREILGKDAEIRFESDEGLICGVELRVDGRAVSWNIRDYVDEFARRVSDLIHDEAVADEEAKEAGDKEGSSES